MSLRTKSARKLISEKLMSAITLKKKRSVFRLFLGVFRRRDKPRDSHHKEEELKVDQEQIIGHDYAYKGVAGTGTFGTVYFACPKNDPAEFVAVKRIEVGDESETREVDVHKLVRHRNVVALKQHWTVYTHEDGIRKAHIYMVMDYLPSTLDDHIASHVAKYTTISALMIKVFSFQMFRGLNYMHSIKIMHRDIKPPNLLVDMRTGMLKICDFGCAKRVKRKRVKHRTYICSRFYRAPELVLNNYKNDEKIDTWAAACVLAECFRGWPLFPGKSTKHQFGAIADVLGNPTPEELYFLNPRIDQVHVKVREADGTFDEHFPPRTPERAMDLLAKLLLYPPQHRLSALEACADPYYDQLRRNPKTLVLPSGAPLPTLFDFSTTELRKASPTLIQQLLPQQEGNSDLCYLDDNAPSVSSSVRSQEASRRASTDSVSTESDVTREEVFSELESADVDEVDLWDCQKMRVLDVEHD